MIINKLVRRYGIQVMGSGKHAPALFPILREQLALSGAPFMVVAAVWMLLVQRQVAFFSNALKVRLLNAYYGNTAVAPPATLYVGLSTSTPGQDGSSFTEPSTSGTAYARVAVTNNTTQWPTATTANPSVKSNANPITFAQATANWGTVTYWGVFEAASGGSPTDMAALTASQAINTGTTASFAAGQLATQIQG